MKLYIENYACMNRSDELSILKTKFISKGFLITNEIEDSDYVLIYTCGSTEAFIKRSFEYVEKTYKQYPQKRLIVCGCSTVTARHLYNNMDLILCSPTNFYQLENELGIVVLKEDIIKAQLTKDIKLDNNIAIVIQKGCRKKCSYCSIWMAVGEIVSKDMKTIIDEVKKCVKQGSYKITLTGDCITDYGIDIGSNIIELIDTICEVSNNIT